MFICYYIFVLYPWTYSIVIDAIQDAYLSDVLTLNSGTTWAEAYDKHGEILKVGLRFTPGTSLHQQFALVSEPAKSIQRRNEYRFLSSRSYRCQDNLL